MQKTSPIKSPDQIVDMAVAALGLAFLSPLLVVIAILIVILDGTPVFFKQIRIGRNGKPFYIWKFRTMRSGAEKSGGSLTVGADARVTPVGSVLRRWKLDELPQLINVLKGEMRFVGARPEVEKYVALYSPEEREILKFPPGITGPASIKFRNESEFLSSQQDPEQYYIDVLMREKIQMDLSYLRQRNLATDLQCIFKTILG